MSHPEQHWLPTGYLFGSLFLWLNGNKPMLRLPLLIRILPISVVKEEAIVGSRFLEVPQVIIGRSPHEICHRSLRQQFGSNIQRVNQDWIIFIVVGCECEIVICSSEVGLQRHRRDELPLSLWRLLLPQQSLAKPIMQLRLIR